MTAERAESMDIAQLQLDVRHTGAAATRGLRPGRGRRRERPPGRARASRSTADSLARVPAKHACSSSSRRASSSDRSGSSRCRASPGPSIRGLAGAGASRLHSDRQALLGPGHGRSASSPPATRPTTRSSTAGWARRWRTRRRPRLPMLAGSQAEAPAFSPVIRGKLLTGSGPGLHERASDRLPRASSRRSSTRPPWPADEKVDRGGARPVPRRPRRPRRRPAAIARRSEPAGASQAPLGYRPLAHGRSRTR